MFAREAGGEFALRAFGGQSCNRTAYAGASTGKQIMTALIREARKYECCELIQRMLDRQLHSALIRNGSCYGALLYNEKTYRMETVYADAVVVASGGQNLLFPAEKLRPKSSMNWLSRTRAHTYPNRKRCWRNVLPQRTVFLPYTFGMKLPSL